MQIINRTRFLRPVLVPRRSRLTTFTGRPTRITLILAARRADHQRPFKFELLSEFELLPKLEHLLNSNIFPNFFAKFRTHRNSNAPIDETALSFLFFFFCSQISGHYTAAFYYGRDSRRSSVRNNLCPLAASSRV